MDGALADAQVDVVVGHDAREPLGDADEFDGAGGRPVGGRRAGGRVDGALSSGNLKERGRTRTRGVPLLHASVATGRPTELTEYDACRLSYAVNWGAGRGG
ncbi:hypothetical protein GCM10010349_14280 [Streptomyces flavofungini]|nr:hypothetical protein GCM10010349_14280 [Streptomyces flavofungini]